MHYSLLPLLKGWSWSGGGGGGGGGGGSIYLSYCTYTHMGILSWYSLYVNVAEMESSNVVEPNEVTVTIITPS